MLLSLNVHAKECVSQWKIKAQGIQVASSVERYIEHSDTSIEIYSKMTPLSGMRILGVPEIERTTKLVDKKIIYREEKNIVRSKTSFYTWNHIKNNEWQFSLNGEKSNHILDGATIDSTTLPYMTVLGFISNSENNKKFIALGKDGPFNVNFKIQQLDNNQYKILTGLDKGYMIVNEDMQINEFGTQQGSISVKGYLQSRKCSL